MKAIVVSESRFNELFEKLLGDLQLAKFKPQEFNNLTPKEKSFIEEIHRAFVYKVHTFKDALNEDK